MSKTIEVPRVDVNMLREQRNELLDLTVRSGIPLDGLINMLDTMLDIAEGSEPVVKYNHAYSMGFSLVSENEHGEDVTGADLRQAILRFLAKINDDELVENCGCPWDTYIEDEV